MHQFVWAGLQDEAGFGVDPVLAAAGGGAAGSTSSSATGVGRWKRTTIPAAAPSDAALFTADGADSHLFRRPERGDTSRFAALLHVGEGMAVLYPPSAQVMALICEGERWQLRDTTTIALEPKSFLIWPDLGDIDAGSLHASEGALSKVWKARLADACTRDRDGLVRRLRGAGLDLSDLRQCLRHWSRPASTVIHAPQRRLHFEILLRVLGLDQTQGSGRSWGLAAWREVAHSRGEAIQVGMQEQDILHEELLGALGESIASIQGLASSGRGFSVDLHGEHGLSGTVMFYLVEAIEEGFRVPEAMLKTILPVEQAFAWRV